MKFMPNFSATKTVFILVALTVCVAFFMNKIGEQAFMAIATMVFMSYYKGEKPVAIPVA